MAGSGILKSYVRADAKLKESGYLKFYLNLIDDFTTLQEPAALDVDSVTGDKFIITDAHVWTAGKTPMSFYIDPKKLTAPGETVGAKGSLSMNYTITVFAVGDGPVIQDLFESIKNEDCVGFTTDECPTSEILQYGCDCQPLNMVKGSFQPGTLEGTDAKGWTFQMETRSRFFYRGGSLTAR